MTATTDAKKVPEPRAQDHWDILAHQLRSLTAQVSDDRLKTVLYQKFFADGWAEHPPFPLSTRNADQAFKHAVMEAVLVEMIERREGRIPSVK